MTHSAPSKRPSSLASLARKTLSALAVGAAVLAAAQSASAGKIAHLSSGSWTGGAFTNNHTGTFSHCAANARYKSGVALYFAVTGARQWSMAFSARHWKFERGRTYPLHYQVDDGPVIQAMAKARSAGLVQVFLPINGQVFNRFQKGTTLKIAAGRTVMQFALTGAGPMLAKLVRCATRHASGTEAGPRSSSRKGPINSSGARLIDIAYR